MGQRLVVDIYKSNKKLASIYYHWSAFFARSIVELSNLSIDILKAEKEGKDPMLGIVEGIEARGGGIRGFGHPDFEKDMEAARKLFPDHKFVTEGTNESPNNGLISFTEDGFESFEHWGEGFASIELDTHEINNGVKYDGEPWLEWEVDSEGYPLTKGRVSYKNDVCKVNGFHFTCETVFELVQFLSDHGCNVKAPVFDAAKFVRNNASSLFSKPVITI